MASAVPDVELRERTYRAYWAALGVDGGELPTEFGEAVAAVTTFADPLARPISGALACRRPSMDHGAT